MIRFYMDENVPKSVTQGVRQRGIDVLTPLETQRTGIADDLQLAYALQQGRVLVTRDIDFLILNQQGIRHAGIVFAGQDVSIGAFIARLELIVGAMTADEMYGHVEFVPVEQSYSKS